MKSNFAYMLLSLALLSCGPVEKPPKSESVSEPEQMTPKTIEPVVTIHCTLKNVKTGRVTKGTYFTYDTRTKDMPSEAMFAGDGSHIKDYEREHFKKWISPYRLTDGIVVLPLQQRRDKFSLDVDNIWYKHGNSWHYFEPQGRFKFTTRCCGIISFGERRKGEDAFEGQFDFSAGNELGGTAGTWSYFGKGDIDPKNREWGYLRCGMESASGDSISIPAGVQ